MEADSCTRQTRNPLPPEHRPLFRTPGRRTNALLNGSNRREKGSKRKQTAPASAPTPGPWSIEDDYIVYCHWRYSGWPNFGRIVVARLDSCWPQGQERRANLELIATTVNACFALAPESPVAAARAFPALVHAVEDFLTHGEDPNMPLDELKARLRVALSAVKGGVA